MRSMRACACLLLFVLCVRATIPGDREQIAGPPDPTKWTHWLNQLLLYREQTLSSINYNGSIYHVPDLLWTQTTYMQVQMHPYDRFFYDPVQHEYTVSKFLDDLNTRYGGIDSALVWPTYPNMGIDNRNQYDMIRSMPGHEAGLTAITAELHAAGVHVLWPYNPWDQGTRYEGVPDPEAIADLIVSTDGDGFNGDTMLVIPEAFYAAAVARGKPLGLEPELAGDEQEMNYGTLGWGYWQYPAIPMVDRYKWLDSRHMINVCDRWAKDRTNDVQAAWFNGDGYVTWENVWGTWNGITPHDGEMIRRVGAMLRFLGARGFLQSQGWQPHYPVVNSAEVFASHFPGPCCNESVWTIINTASTNLTGPQMSVASMPGMRYYDVYRGVQLMPSFSTADDGAETVTLAFPLEANGYGCILATLNRTNAGDGSPLGEFLAEMAAMTARSLESYDDTWEYLLQEMLPAGTTPLASSAPAGMQAVPRGLFNFQVSGVEIEGTDAFGVDFQYPWEPYPRREHSHTLFMGAFYIDKYPVTNAQYKQYLTDSHYTPLDPWNFLKEWTNGSYPTGWDKKPVTWVSLDEARAYCSFYNKRLPSELEWQYAAQGTDGRLYPWGNVNNQSLYPVPLTGRNLPPAADVDAFTPAADSPFGVSDLVGNVWQYTSAFQDNHTRTVVLRGSSNYRPNTSMWYYPTALQLNLHNKYLLFDDAYDRSGKLGFRCVVDADPTCLSPMCVWADFPQPVVNLTATGSLDWEHWAAPHDGHDRKAGVTALLSPIQVVGPGTATGGANASTVFTWTDGTKDPTGNWSTYLAVAGAGSGFAVSAPADGSTRRMLNVFLGGLNAQVAVTAEMSDGSAPPYNTQFSAAGYQLFVYAFEFVGGSPGAVLAVTWTVLPQCNTSLCGTVAAPVPVIDLTQEGSGDWVHWGLTSPQSVDRMAVPTMPAIPAVQVVGGGVLAQYSNNPTTFSWTNGQPDVAETTTTGIFLGNSAVGKGFRLVLPAGSDQRALRLYVGVWLATGRLTVSRAGTVLFSDDSLSNQAGTTNGVYTVRYKQVNPGDMITIEWIQEDGTGNITLQAATLSESSDGSAVAAAATLAVDT